MDAQRVLAAIAEPTRFRIVQLLASAPRTVGEIAAHLGALQPQTTKHLQAMEAAGVITAHPLGRRRVMSLRRDVLEHLAGGLAALAAGIPDVPVLEQYERAIAEEQARPAGDRVIRAVRDLRAAPSAVYRAWTEPETLRRWWAPQYFEVVVCEIQPSAGAPIRIVLREGDGAEYTAAGRVVSAVPDREVVFELAPVDGDGVPLFTAEYTVKVSGDARTELAVEIRVTGIRPEAAPAIAGLEVGLPHLLDQLAQLVQG